MLREKGHLGFLGHNDYCEFPNIRIKELPATNPHNIAPKGFTKLFNGRDLEGWKGLVGDPVKRAKMTPLEMAVAQIKADQDMAQHWRVEDGALVFDGKGKSLCTAKDYADFEMLVDWKILPDGDSGIYLHGSPQIQIWDPWGKNEKARVGSGGVFNNQTHPAAPTKLADHFIGDWNRFRILMVGEKVHVFLNGELVVNNVTMENYWDRTQPIFPTGQLELQNHGNTLWFRNVYVREINTSSPIASAPPPPQPPKAAPAAKGKKAAPKAAPKKK
ncbi:MAG: DUF1080 domain-containing protein [Verrucomicrobia bacterium]|nr:DUF1080 domain-containing protein [Verrucomicrobiota bacterium]